MKVKRADWFKPRRISGRRAWENVIGIDGEGESDDADSAQRYTLLAASTGQFVETHDLSSERCFDFLLSLPKRSLCVGYSINYDINMWLKDLPLDALTELWEDGSCEWHGYWIVWHPGKMFSLGRNRNIKPYLTHSGEKRKRITYEEHITIWDVFGFFQSSFVNALNEWDIGAPAERERIERMKAQRGTFSAEDKEQVRAYCLDECRLLAIMVKKLIDYALSIGIKLTRYDGAGAVASAMLRKFRVDEFIGLPPKDVHTAAMHGYFGGRFETAIIGHVKRAYAYDINSAYPTQTVDLPCLRSDHCSWKRTTEVEKRGIYHVTWNLERLIPRWGPFPYRLHDGAICYPMSGEGWYWGQEVAAAQCLYPLQINVTDGYALIRHCECKPFAFVPDYYQRRRDLKACGNFAQIVLKLGLNSLYGKCAQSVGGKVIGKTADGSLIHDRPRYQSFVWAGMITSGTRAKILDAIRLAGAENVLSIATDGIISRTLIANLDVGNGLGQWEIKTLVDVAIVQNGVYEYSVVTKDDFNTRSERVRRARGFSGREFDFGNLAYVFGTHREHGIYSTSVVRFQGLGSSLQRNPKLTDWRHWAMVPKTVKLAPPNRLTFSDLAIADDNLYMVNTVAYHGMLGAGVSHPYSPKAHFAHLWSDDVENDYHQPD